MKIAHMAGLFSALFVCSLPAHAVPSLGGPDVGATLTKPADFSSGARIDAGRTLYEAKGCVQCHGTAGQGGVRLAGNALTPESAYLTIANGRMRGGLRMPTWKGILSEDEIWSLSAYVISLQRQP